MMFPFETIWLLLKSLPNPDRGSRESWRKWYETAWQHLGNAKLIEVNRPIDVTRAKLTAFSLCWLAHDFDSATYEEFEDRELYWQDWYQTLEISPLITFAITTEQQLCHSWLAEAPVFAKPDEIDEFEDPMDFCQKELESDLAARTCATVAFKLRPDIFKALVTGFGDVSRFFASMFIASQDWDPIARYTETYREELEEIEEDLENEDVLPNERLDLEARRDDLIRILNREDLLQLAYEESVNEILNGTIDFSDEEFNQRLAVTIGVVMNVDE